MFVTKVAITHHHSQKDLFLSEKKLSYFLPFPENEDCKAVVWLHNRKE